MGKTGYIAGVSCLSGYIMDKAGRGVIAYSILCNAITGPADAKQLENAVCETLVDWLDKP